MSEKTLSSPIISVRKDGVGSYGGSQKLFPEKTLRGCGCGVIAAADLVYYLAFSRRDWATPYTGTPRANELEFEQYARLCRRLRSRYLPIIPHFGKTGPALAAGLNAYFSNYSIPLRARWCIGHHKLFERIGEMLTEDLPVIFSVGANFPLFWGRHRVNLYTRTPSGAMSAAAGTKAHFMTVTGMDDDFLRVSSWGQEYFISRREYSAYTKAHGCPVTSNILYLKKI